MIISSTHKFLSTLSLRRATLTGVLYFNKKGDFYPRSPCGERQFRLGADHSEPLFLSTLSLRRATVRASISLLIPFISIHALLAESDPLPCGIDTRPINFYPRSPCGERPRNCKCLLLYRGFLSTLSLRRATALISSI